MAKKNPPSDAGQTRVSNRESRREAAQAELRRVQTQQRRSRLLFTGAVVLVVVAIFAVVAVYGLNHKKGSGAKTTAASAKLEQQLSTIPLATYDAVGAGTSTGGPRALSGSTPMTEDGKPRVLYVGAEYCPFCAAERWAMVTALARFGTFKNLGQTTSSHADQFPDTPTLSFHGSSYTSKYIAFKGYETQSNQVQGNSYAPLDKLSTADGKIFDKYDFPPYFDSQGAIPFIDFGGVFGSQGATYSPQLFAGLTHEQVADQIADPSTAISKAVLGSANTFTAAICQLTKSQPSAVCNAKGVVTARGSLSQ